MADIYNSQLDAFELYHKIQEQSHPSNGYSQSSSFVHALGHGFSGSTGAAISNLATYPLSLIITRLQIQRQLRTDQSRASESEYRGLQDAASKIYHNEGGLSGLYTGAVHDTGKTIADSFLFFLSYHFLRARRLRAREGAKSLPAMEELAVGFVAGSLTKLFTTPIANVVTRKQAAALTRKPEPEKLTSRQKGEAEESATPTKSSTPSSREIVQQIMSENGLQGFWSGYSASLVLTLNPSLTFFLFETFKRLLLPRSQREKPPGYATFLLAAIAKACASSVTYPFSLAKTRLQAGPKQNDDHDNLATIDSQTESSSSRSRKQRLAQATIFSTVLAIARSEGPSALYEGLHLEVFKAFFSHGTTMLVKQLVQRLSAQLYYITSIIMGRYRRHRLKPGVTFSKMSRKAKENVEYYNLALQRASEKLEAIAHMDERAGSKGLIGKAYETAEFVAEYVIEGEEGDVGVEGKAQSAEGAWRELYGSTGLSAWFLGDRKPEE